MRGPRCCIFAQQRGPLHSATRKVSQLDIAAGSSQPADTTQRQISRLHRDKGYGLTAARRHAHLERVGCRHLTLRDGVRRGVALPVGIGTVGVDGGAVAATRLEEIERKGQRPRLLVGRSTEEVAVARTAHHRHELARFAGQSTRPVAVGVKIAEELEGGVPLCTGE